MKYIIYISLILLSSSVFAQVSTVVGKVIDDKGEELIGATIQIEGTQKGTISDYEGNYEIENVPSGEQTLICSFVSYEPVKKTVNVLIGDHVQMDFVLSEAVLNLEGVQVVAKADRESENSLLMAQKKSIKSIQSIGAEELSRKGISNAETAVSKISGISKQEGVKNVFVRGLGDRYNSTTLNGFVIPSEDPEYKNISLEFFTNDMIQAIDVNKVFSSSMYGDVGGALIDIRSKELFDDTEFEIGMSTSINSQVAGTDLFLPDGFNRFGYANSSESSNIGFSDNINSYFFNASLDPIQKSAPYDKGISMSWGKKFLKNHRFYLVGAYNTDYQYQEGISRLITATDPENPYRDMTYKKSIMNASHLLMGNVDLNFDKSILTYNGLYIHTGSGYSSDFFGKEGEIFQGAQDYDYQGLIRRQQINDNTILINQFIWSGNLSEKIKYNVGGSLNNITGKEPDRRIYQFPSIGNGLVQLASGEGRNQRFNSKITETSFSPKINLQYNLSKNSDRNSYIEVGYDSRMGLKKFSAPIYNHIWNPELGTPTFELGNIMLNQYFNQNNLNNNSFEVEYFNDTYDVIKHLHGSYIDLVYQLSNKVTANAGLRADYVFTKIDYEVNRMANVGSDTINGFYLSPSFNIKYAVNDKNHIRIGSSRTFTLPQDKEISPFVYQGIDGNDNGNPDLEVSTNYNFDIKWDYYISNSEIFTLNGFYKYILKPIARVDQGNSAGLKTFDNVSDHAIAAGVEMELRKKLLKLGNKHHFNLGINASYIYSKIKLDPVWFVHNTTSTLEGSAPYIVNSDLTYYMVSDQLTIESSIIFNYLSDKVHTIGTRGFNNLIEESITTLDFVNLFKINDHFGISLKAKNLLNPEFKLTRKGVVERSNIPNVVIRSYKKGISFDLGITYKL